MALSNSQYDAIMRAYGRQQIENHHQLEERRREIYRKLPVIKELEAEIAGRSVACARKLLEGETGVLDKLREDLQDLREQKALIIKAAGYPDNYLELQYRCPDCRDDHHSLRPGNGDRLRQRDKIQCLRIHQR